MMYQLDNNTFFYDATNDHNYNKIQSYVRINGERKSNFFVSLYDKNVLRKHKINSFLKLEPIIKENSNFIIYRNNESYYCCKNILSFQMNNNQEMIIKFDNIHSSTTYKSIDFYRNYVEPYKEFFINHFSCENTLELIKRFR